MKFLKYFLIMFLIAEGFWAFPITLTGKVGNKIFSDNIRTVQLYREGWKTSNPIVQLNSEQKLVLTFDDISGEVKEYYYTFYHCDRNWEISDIPREEYFNSFVEFPITDWEYAVNTKVGYINYYLQIPNNDVGLSLSGNYILVVYDYEYPDEPVFTRKFYVVEPKVDITARIRQATFDLPEGECQEIDFYIDHGNFQIDNPRTDIKVVLTQNNRHDNAITDLQPVYMSGGRLEYNQDIGNVFYGNNEFRNFEIRSYKYAGEGVQEVGFFKRFYHVTLEPSEIRTQKKYSFNRDLNGRYYIEAYNTDYPDLEADYMFVHFTLPLDNVLMGGGVYVFGALSNWQCSRQNQMKWNPDKGQYELTLLLKQGYYNFMYAWKDLQTGKIKLHALEGSHAETENDYQIFVYYGRLTDRYDRLVGYKVFNSLVNRNF